MQTPAVVGMLFDDMPVQARQSAEIWIELFRRMGLAARIPIFNKLEEATFETHLEARPHLVIMDLNWGVQDPLLGQKIISKYKDQYPDILFVLQTNQVVDASRTAAMYPYPDLFVSKRALAGADSKYATYLMRQIGQHLRRRSARITVMDNAGSPWALADGREDPISSEELQSVVEQITFQRLDPDSRSQDRLEFESIVLEKIEAGRSGAYVFLSRWSRSDGLESADLIVKVDKRSVTLRELINYEKHVKYFIPYAARVDVIGSGNTAKWGGIAYSFVLKGKREAVSLGEFVIKKGKVKEAKRRVSALFRDLGNSWYHNGMIERTANASSYYSKFLEDRNDNKSFAELEYELINLLQTKGATLCWGLEVETSGTGFRIGNAAVEGPTRLLTAGGLPPVRFSLCHGDLHSGNIMISKKSSGVAVIDFGRTGIYPRFYDFVFLELSIRLDWPLSDDSERTFDELYKREVQEWKSFVNGAVCHQNGIWEVIHEIRCNAPKTLSNGPIDFNFIEYLCCAMSVAWWLITRKWLESYSANDTCYTRIAAFLLASLTLIQECTDKDELVELSSPTRTV